MTSIVFVGEVVGQAGAAWTVDQAFAVEETERQLFVVSGRTHGHGQRLTVDADLERLLDGDLVAHSVAEHGGDHARAHCAPGRYACAASAGVCAAASLTGRTSTATTLYSGQLVLTSAEEPISRLVRTSGK